jgi:hypothetical protein
MPAPWFLGRYPEKVTLNRFGGGVPGQAAQHLVEEQHATLIVDLGNAKVEGIQLVRVEAVEECRDGHGSIVEA